MGCGEFQQVRPADFFHATFTDEVADESPIDLGDALDVGKAREIVVTVLVTSMTIASPGTGIELVGLTAAVNNPTYYGVIADDPLVITPPGGGEQLPKVFVGTFTTFSRFWLPKFLVAGEPDGASNLSGTIDVVIR